MDASADRLDFAPPAEPAAVRGFALAILAHILLMLALTWGINWNREADSAAAEAELWASVPQEAAPTVAPAPPVPPPVVQAPPVTPPPVEKVAPPPPVPKAPDISIEREKRQREEAQRRQEQQELERQKKLDAQKKLEAQKKAEAQKKQDEARRVAAAEKQKAAEDAKRKEDQAKAAKDKARQQLDAKKMDAIRQENLRRMQGLAGATGAPSATGNAPRASGMSDSYAGRVQGRVRPHIVFTDEISGNPSAEVEVKMSPDGTIVSRRIVKSSGVKSWDDAVLRALDKTEVLPRDVDGRVPTPLVIQFRPRS